MRKELLLLLVALVVAMLAAGCPDACPPPPEPEVCEDGGDPMTVSLADQHAAVWMTTDNSFVDDLGTVKVCGEDKSDEENFGKCAGNYYEPAGAGHSENAAVGSRPGIMIQLGAVDSSLGKEYHYAGITLNYADGTDQTYDRDSDDIRWIDVYPAEGPCVIDALHAYAMFQNDIVATDCDTVTTDPSSAVSCLRNRSLHASFVPDAGLITIWPDSSMYTVESTWSGHGHATFLFSFCDALVVDVWSNGCFEQQRSDVVSIEVRYTTGGGSDHTIFHDNPLNGGNFSLP